MVQTGCGMAGKESKLFFNFFSTGGKHAEFLRKTGDLNAVTSGALPGERKTVTRHAWRSQVKFGKPYRPDTLPGKNCRRLQTI